jgi:type I restriction enzyme S subunit
MTSLQAYKNLLTDKSRPRKNDILLTKDGTLGRLAVVGEETICINQSVAVIRTNRKADPLFIKFLLEGNSYQKRMIEDAGGSTIKHIYITIVDKMPIGLPSDVSEQRAIATALSDVDALLEELDRLIAKKRDIKQATMQQLLTGQTRLPGFEQEWETKRIGELLTICHGRNQHEVEVKDGQFPILATSGVIGTSKHALYNRPSVLIGRKGTINKPRYMATPFWSVDTLFYSVIEEDNDAKYLYYQFLMIDWLQYNEASGVPSLSARTIENIEINCPQPLEQRAISSVLSDLDTEIQFLEQSRTKTAAIKQAMMQDLLTGRIRLIETEAVAEAGV